MKIIIASLATVFMLSNSASAHEDSVLPISADGSISGIPPEFGTAKINIEFSQDGTFGPVSRLEVYMANKSLVFPACLSNLLETKSIQTVKASGSWYHDESRLPYYLHIDFHDQTYNPATWINTGYSILLNLRANSLIHMKKYVILDGGLGYQNVEVNLKAQCADSELENFSYDSSL